MKYEVIGSFRVKSFNGEIELQPGQLIILSKQKALILLSQSKIVPSEKGAYRVYSDILKAYIWIVMDKGELEALRAYQDTSEPIYTAAELKMLKGMDQKTLEVIKNVKNIFEFATVEEFRKETSGK